MNEKIERIKDKLEFCIKTNQYQPIETENIELKDASTKGDWKSIHETVCAFLNTEGGSIIFGIKEVQDKGKKWYKFTGYDENNEENYKKIATVFYDDTQKNLLVTEYLRFEIVDFLQGRICILYINSLPVQEKFAFYENKAYQRTLTGDIEISEAKLLQQKELKENLSLSRELQLVPSATITHLDVDTLNDYIYQINRDVKVETTKPDIMAAKSFLERKKFLINNEVTTLGMLVCGKNPEDFLGERCQVDCYVDSEVEVVRDKKVLKGNILSLMTRAINFVMKNIQVGVSPINGGQAVTEYPEKLLRESINNALAHRDYSQNKYTTIVIKPNTSIEIRNAGLFKKNLLIEQHQHSIPLRRILPDVKRNNPLLVDILKSYDRYEGRGIGISVLTNECLNNKIDLPYYKFHSDNEMSLVIRKGKLLDDEISSLLESYNGFILKMTNGVGLTEEHQLVLAYLIKSERENQNYRYTILLTPDNNHLQAIGQLKTWGLITEHELSTSNIPVFIVHRQLLQKDFIIELRKIFGGAYDNLSQLHKDCVQVVYQYTYFANNKSLTASKVSNFLWLKQKGEVQSHQLKEFDSFKRKIRKIFEQLQEEKMIIKQENTYCINEKFERTKSLLFD